MEVAPFAASRILALLICPYVGETQASSMRAHGGWTVPFRLADPVVLFFGQSYYYDRIGVGTGRGICCSTRYHRHRVVAIDNNVVAVRREYYDTAVRLGSIRSLGGTSLLKTSRYCRPRRLGRSYARVCQVKKRQGTTLALP